MCCQFKTLETSCCINVSINLFLSIDVTSAHMEQEDQYREVLTVSKETKLRQLRAGVAKNMVFYQLGVVVKCHGKFKGCS